jgi:hypothetical protein
MNGGDLLFVPNRALGTNTTKENSYKIYHTGNKPTYSDVGAAAASHTHTSSQISDRINTTAVGALGWTSKTADDQLVTRNTIAY